MQDGQKSQVFARKRQVFVHMTEKKAFPKEEIMDYISTRSAFCRVDSARAVLDGLAPDGGLYLPETLPDFDWQACLKLDTKAMAKMILSALLPEIPNMDTLVDRAYDGKFETEELTPLVKVGDRYVLELFRGPTSAFKDVALCMLPQLMTAAKTAKGEEKDILILTATSGDTGKAALEGFRDVPGIRICVFYPHGGVSAVQRAQMVTQEGANVTVAAVRGNFDDAQTGVKNIFTACRDRELPVVLSSANSINIGRLAPQITYYFAAYRCLLDRGEIAMGDQVNFSVPTGNFGDILAGFLAKQLGLPVGRLICASNSNNVLTEFLETGRYNRIRLFYKTKSPSMDILVSSNLERLLYLLSGDCELVKSLMDQLASEGRYHIPPYLHTRIRNHFWGGSCGDLTALQTIGSVWKDRGYLMDPHTAVGWDVATDYVNQTGDDCPMVVLSTASPYKFPAAVLSALTAEEGDLLKWTSHLLKPQEGDEFAMMERLEEMTGVAIPRNLRGLREKEERHTTVIDKDEMLPFVLGL